ncbi:Uncharacterized protein PBTT_04390 [Plasmodiophora brassicae]
MKSAATFAVMFAAVALTGLASATSDYTSSAATSEYTSSSFTSTKQAPLGIVLFKAARYASSKIVIGKVYGNTKYFLQRFYKQYPIPGAIGSLLALAFVADRYPSIARYLSNIVPYTARSVGQGWTNLAKVFKGTQLNFVHSVMTDPKKMVVLAALSLLLRVPDRY